MPGECMPCRLFSGTLQSALLTKTSSEQEAGESLPHQCKLGAAEWPTPQKKKKKKAHKAQPSPSPQRNKSLKSLGVGLQILLPTCSRTHLGW